MPSDYLPDVRTRNPQAGKIFSVSDRFREEQLVRADGTVIVSWIVAPHAFVIWEPEPWCTIVGPCFGRVRYMDPASDWYVIASFPHGYPGPMEWSQELPPDIEFRAELEWME